MNREIGRKTVFGLVIPVIIVTLWFYVTTFGSIPTGILPSMRNGSRNNGVGAGSMRFSRKCNRCER